jgi:SAM-dependent methyltransferase
MDARDRLSLIGHSGMSSMSPLAESELASLLDACALAPGDRVLDLGCGRGDFALLAASRVPVHIVGVDRSPAACEQARQRTGGVGDIVIVCDDVPAYLARQRPSRLALACAIGAVHAFGSRIDSWTDAVAALEPIARRILVADLVATGPRAVEVFDVATREELRPIERRAHTTLVLPGERVIAYERAWCAAVAASPVLREGDPRSAWARERLAWSESVLDAWCELEFVALVIESGKLS